MQTRCRQYGVVASMALALILAACGSSSTGPKPLTARQLATHFDSIYSALLAAGTSADSQAAFFIGEYVEASPAYGAVDASVTVTTGSGTQVWRGNAFAEVTTSGDSTFLFALYPDRNLSKLVLVEIGRHNGPAGASSIGTIDRFTTVNSDSVVSGTASVVSTGGACALQTGLAAGALLGQVFAGLNCLSAQINVSLSVGFKAATNVGSVTLSNVTFTGVQFAQPGASHVVGIPSRAAAAALGFQSLLDHRR